MVWYSIFTKICATSQKAIQQPLKNVGRAARTNVLRRRSVPGEVLSSSRDKVSRNNDLTSWRVASLTVGTCWEDDLFLVTFFCRMNRQHAVSCCVVSVPRRYHHIVTPYLECVILLHNPTIYIYQLHTWGYFVAIETHKLYLVRGMFCMGSGWSPNIKA